MSVILIFYNNNDLIPFLFRNVIYAIFLLSAVALNSVHFLYKTTKDSRLLSHMVNMFAE